MPFRFRLFHLAHVKLNLIEYIDDLIIPNAFIIEFRRHEVVMDIWSPNHFASIDNQHIYAAIYEKKKIYNRIE